MHPAVIISSALALIFGLAIVAVVVSKQSQTGSVLQSAGGALSSVITAAVSPVTGQVGTQLGTSFGNYVTNPLAGGGIFG